MSFTESLEKIVEENRNQLVGKHVTWERVRLADVASILNGFPFESSRFGASPEKGHPLIRIRDVLRSVSDTYYEGEFDPAYLVHSGDLLVGMDGDFNSAIWWGTPGLLNQRVCKIDLYSLNFDKRFLTYCLPGYLSAINASTSSLTVKHLSSLTVADIPLPLPPLNEQSRIADALDELLSDLDAGVAALEQVRVKLKLYRVAVLKAAVEGGLTAEWRTQYPDTESASDLLKRILVERRRRWEEEQLRKFRKKGAEPPRNWKAKYKEPVAPNTTGLPPLPEGWCWTSLDALIVEGPQNGLYLPSTLYGRGVEILRIDDFQNGWTRPREELKRVEADRDAIATYALHLRDLVINRVNSMTHLGKCCLVADGFAGVLFESNMMRLEIAEAIDARYVELYLHSEAGRRRLTKDAKWAVNQASINQEDVKKTPVPLSPLAEQEAFVGAAEAQLSVIDHLEADLGAKLLSAQALRQSILRRAFSGKLVPQDPKDEPASELLKRIAAEREQRAREAAAAKRVNDHKPRPAPKPRRRAARAKTTKKETEHGRVTDR